MEIYPHDLGEGYAKDLLVRRNSGGMYPHHAFLFRTFFWRTTNLSRATVDQILKKTKRPVSVQDLFALGAILAINVILFALTEHLFPSHTAHSSTVIPFLGVSLPYLVRSLSSGIALVLIGEMWMIERRWSRLLTIQETIDLRSVTNPPKNAALAYAYLIQEMVQADNITPAAQPALRDAVRLLGEALYKLTGPETKWSTPGEFAQWSNYALRKAELEDDPKIKRALLSEAASYKQAARESLQNQLNTRRNQALLDELLAQISAFRISLKNFSSSADTRTEQLSHLTEKARTIATEAAAEYPVREEAQEPVLLSAIRG